MSLQELSALPSKNLALLNSPHIISRSGTPFSLDNRNVLLQASKLQGLGLNAPNLQALQAQFPPQRLQTSLAQRLSGAGDLQPPLNMLCDAVINCSKRSREVTPLTPAKRIKTAESPVLLQRLCTMGGGFPMPKWGIAKKVPPKVQLSSKGGTFPMPPTTEDEMFNTQPQLKSFKSLWSNTQEELRKPKLLSTLRRTNYPASLQSASR